MSSLHRERRGRTLRWAILSPLASLLVVGSAWAQSTGKWPVIWKAVTSVFAAGPVPGAAPPASQRPREQASPARDEPPAPAADSPPDGGAGDVPPVVLPSPRGEEPVLGVEPKASRRAPAPARRRTLPAPPGARSLQPEASAPAHRAPEPERDRELGRFRRAHDLHFNGRARDAIEAYAEYLRDYPEGRFVPEARYAMALDQIKLGNGAAARDALGPFAAGRYGSYRQKEARRLIDALDAKKKAGGR
jgi:hypothetical protein